MQKEEAKEFSTERTKAGGMRLAGANGLMVELEAKSHAANLNSLNSLHFPYHANPYINDGKSELEYH